MIIRLIPESESERSRSPEIEITNVKEFFLMGNNVVYEYDGDSEVPRYNEFHEWTGSHRYLIGTLQYYYEVINDERRGSHNRSKGNSPIIPQLRRIDPETDLLDDENE